MAAEIKLQRERDAAQALNDYEGNRVAILAKTERLRAAWLVGAARP